MNGNGRRNIASKTENIVVFVASPSARQVAAATVYKRPETSARTAQRKSETTSSSLIAISATRTAVQYRRTTVAACADPWPHGSHVVGRRHDVESSPGPDGRPRATMLHRSALGP